MNIGVYRLKWETSPKVYYGASKDLKQRKGRHLCDLKRGGHNSHLVQEVYNEHGMPEFEVLLTCEKEDLDYYEGVLLKLAEEEGNSLNKNFDPTGKGKVPTEEHRKKQSAAMKGRVFSETHIENLRIANLGEKNPMFGKFFGENPRAKKVINTETLEVYSCARELVMMGKVSMHYGTFIAGLGGRRPNFTPYEYLDVYEANGGKKSKGREKIKPKARRVINTETLEVYSCAKDLVVRGLLDMPYGRLTSILSGQIMTNPTPYEYLDVYEKNGNKKSEPRVKSHPSYRKVINTQTGKIYDSAIGIVDSGLVDLNYGTFQRILSGKVRTNPTPFEYLETYIANGNKKREPFVKQNIKAKKVINTITGEMYNSASEAAEKGGIDVGVLSLRGMLNGRIKTNTTPFMYLENYENQKQNDDITTTTEQSSREIQYSK